LREVTHLSKTYAGDGIYLRINRLESERQVVRQEFVKPSDIR